MQRVTDTQWQESDSETASKLWEELEREEEPTFIAHFGRWAGFRCSLLLVFMARSCGGGQRVLQGRNPGAGRECNQLFSFLLKQRCSGQCRYLNNENDLNYYRTDSRSTPQNYDTLKISDPSDLILNPGMFLVNPHNCALQNFPRDMGSTS